MYTWVPRPLWPSRSVVHTWSGGASRGAWGALPLCVFRVGSNPGGGSFKALSLFRNWRATTDFAKTCAKNMSIRNFLWSRSGTLHNPLDQCTRPQPGPLPVVGCIWTYAGPPMRLVGSLLAEINASGFVAMVSDSGCVTSKPGAARGCVMASRSKVYLAAALVITQPPGIQS